MTECQVRQQSIALVRVELEDWERRVSKIWRRISMGRSVKMAMLNGYLLVSRSS